MQQCLGSALTSEVLRLLDERGLLQGLPTGSVRFLDHYGKFVCNTKE